MSMTTTRIPDSHCHACGTLFDRASDLLGRARPKPGDISVCVRCGVAATYDQDLRVVPLSASELAALPDEVRDKLARYVRAVRALGPS